MTKKDYLTIARTINGATIYHDEMYVKKLDLIERLCMRFKEDNPRFDRNKFLEACGVEEYNDYGFKKETEHVPF